MAERAGTGGVVRPAFGGRAVARLAVAGPALAGITFAGIALAGIAFAGFASPAPLAARTTRSEAVTPGAAGVAGDTLRLTLADAVRLAVERSPAVEAERLASVQADARVDEARSDLLPHLSVDAVHGDRTFNTASFGLEFPTAPGQDPLFDPDGEVVGPVTTVDVRGHVAQTLLDWSAVEGVRAARAGATASATHADAARERVAAEAAAAWVRAVRAGGRMVAREADVALAEELADVARELLASGVGVRLDVTRARSQLAGMEAQLVAARSDAERARLALLRVLSLPLDTPVDPDGALADIEAPGWAEVDAGAEVAGALERRADVREMDQRLAAARLDARAVRAERLPTVSLVAGDGFTGAAYPHLLNTYEWGLRVSVPIFEGGRRGAREQVEEARVGALEARRRELREGVAFSVRDALLRVEAAERLIEASGDRLELAADELEQARERFAAGVAGSADVFTASLRLNEARTADVDARAAWWAARVALAAAEGTARTLR